MLIVKLLGGLGNQLYQYALAKSLEAKGREVKLDISAYLPGAAEPEQRPLELSRFPALRYAAASKKEIHALADNSSSFFARARRKLLGSRARCVEEPEGFSEEIFSLENAYLEGFWQNEAYFSDILPELKEKELRFPVDGMDQINAIYCERISRQASVGIHIRRTDYLDEDKQARYGGICTDAYYAGALKEAGEAEHYYLFSDDPAYTLKYVPGLLPPGAEYTLCDWNHGKRSFFDLPLMASCRVMICANSSFSAWGARLGKREDRRMIAPYPMDNLRKRPVEELKEQWKGWQFIDPEGRLL